MDSDADFDLSNIDINSLNDNKKNSKSQQNKNNINTNLHNIDILDIFKNIELNYKKVHGNNFNYDKNFECHLDDKLTNFLSQDSKTKKKKSFFSNLFKKLF